MTDRDTRSVSHARAGRADIDPDLLRPLRPHGKPGKPYRVPLRHLITVFLGGVAGTLARHGIGRLIESTDPWPWAVMVVNLAGSLILGWVLEHLAAEYAGRVKIVKIDADANPETVTTVGVTSIPTLSFYRDGERVDMLIGAHPKPSIAAKIDGLLA